MRRRSRPVAPSLSHLTILNIPHDGITDCQEDEMTALK
jgi:hypothetical protein